MTAWSTSNVRSEKFSCRDVGAIAVTVPSKTTSVAQYAWQAGPLDMQLHASAGGAPTNSANTQNANATTMELIRVENNRWPIAAGTLNIIMGISTGTQSS